MEITIFKSYEHQITPHSVYRIQELIAPIPDKGIFDIFIRLVHERVLSDDNMSDILI